MTHEYLYAYARPTTERFDVYRFREPHSLCKIVAWRWKFFSLLHCTNILRLFSINNVESVLRTLAYIYEQMRKKKIAKFIRVISSREV